MRALLLLVLVAASAAPAAARPLDEVGAGDKPDWWDWTTVVPGQIGLGGGKLTEEEVAYVAAQGFGSVLSLREEHEDPADALAAHDLTYLRIPLGDAEHDTLSVEEMQQALDFIDAQIADGRAVYVHCTAGWHRSPAVVAAWLMVKDGTDADTAWEKLDDIRPMVEPRWIDAVYAYEAHLGGKPKLEVDVHVGRVSPKIGDVIDMTAVVTLGGVPVEGAEVHLEADYDSLEVDTVTDADGRATLTFEFDGTKRQYVHALARYPGTVPGYDRATMYGDGSREERGAFTFTLDAPSAPVAPGEPVTLHLEAVNAAGDPYNARVTVGDGERTLWRGYIGRDGVEDATFPAPAAASALHVRVTSPYAPTVVETVTLQLEGAASRVDGPPADEPRAEAPPAEAGRDDLEGVVGAAPASREAPSGALVAAVLALGLGARAKRSC